MAARPAVSLRLNQIGTSAEVPPFDRPIRIIMENAIRTGAIPTIATRCSKKGKNVYVVKLNGLA